MNRAIKSVLALAVVVLAASAAQAADIGLMPGSKLWLTGSSTIHEYSSTATKLDVVLKHDAAAWDAALPVGDAIEKLVRAHGVTAVEVTVPVRMLRSGKDGLDKNMYKALLAEKNPEIRFAMTGYEIRDGAKAGEIAIEAKGKLTIAGAEKEQVISATAMREGEALRLRARVPLKMTQFGIKPPTMMMGTLRTSDDVTVQFDLLIGAAAATPPVAEAKDAAR